MSKKSVIQRRDLEPLWHKATKVARLYEKAVNCVTSVVGADGVSVQLSPHPKAALFCSICKRYNANSHKLALDEYPCSATHRDAIQEARKLGGSYIYTCPLGFIFWTSPFFCGERFAGALISCGVLAGEKQKIAENIYSVSKGEIFRSKISSYLEDIPERSIGEIQSLARILQLCAEQISANDPRREEAPESGGGSPRRPKARMPDFTDRERLLVACLRRGDYAEAQKTVRSIIKELDAACGGNFERCKFKAIELVVTLSRTGAGPENSKEFAESNNRYLKWIEDSKNAGELAENLCVIVEMMAGKMFAFQGIRHASALRRAERFIWKNYTRKISLKEIADESGLSAPYFSTIFKDEMGENLSNYLNRLRVEKASAMLCETEYPIKGISAACGFVDQSWFSKIFKNYTGTSPCKFREQGGIENDAPETIIRQVILN